MREQEGHPIHPHIFCIIVGKSQVIFPYLLTDFMQ